MRVLLVLLIAFMPQLIVAYNQTQSSNLYCNDLKPQKNFDFKESLGLWYGAEIITNTESYEMVYDPCVVIHLADITDEFGSEHYDDNNAAGKNEQHQSNNNFHGSSRRLRMLWDEKERSLHFFLRVDSVRQGFWMIYAIENSTKMGLPYNKFTGSVQVMKALDTRLILTFCESGPKRKIFTVILTRKRQILSSDEVESVRNLLCRRGLNVQSKRIVCHNSSTSLSSCILLVTLTVCVIALLSRKN